jgi:hypothetical protein
MTISPLGGCSLNQTTNSAKVPRLVSSNNLEMAIEHIVKDNVKIETE